MGYRKQLQIELTRRRTVNARYSLRSFARHLKLSPGFLSNVINGAKSLSPEKAQEIGQVLGFGAELAAEFAQGAERFVSLDTFHAISDWHHYAILDLTFCEGFRSDPRWIARRLGISVGECESAIARLLRLGLLIRKGSRLVKTESWIATPSGKPSQALRNFHRQMITKAGEALDGQPVEERDITGITLTVDPANLEKARAEIRRFRRRMGKLLGTGKLTEVYQLNVQLFKLTKGEGKR